VKKKEVMDDRFIIKILILWNKIGTCKEFGCKSTMFSNYAHRGRGLQNQKDCVKLKYKFVSKCIYLV
jgi:hypothetical protein